MTDESDKSVAVWWPNLRHGVPDVTEWASLCLWYDQIMLGPPFSTRVSGNRTDVWYHSNTLVEPVFLNVISELLKEGTIRLFERFDTETHADCIPDWANQWVNGIVEKHLHEMETDFYYECSEGLSSIIASTYYKLPFTTSEPAFGQQYKPGTPAEHLSEILATTAISQLALPEVHPAHVDDLLEARTVLRDELLEFRAGILNLTWLLHQQIKGKNDLTEIRQEADMLVSTKIKAAVMSLEHRMRQHENKRIQRMLFGTGRVLVDATKMVLPGGWQEKLVAGGKSLLQAATEVDSAKPPEDQVATYLYRLKRQLKS